MLTNPTTVVQSFQAGDKSLIGDPSSPTTFIQLMISIRGVDSARNTNFFRPRFSVPASSKSQPSAPLTKPKTQQGVWRAVVSPIFLWLICKLIFLSTIPMGLSTLFPALIRETGEENQRKEKKKIGYYGPPCSQIIRRQILTAFTPRTHGIDSNFQIS